MAACEKVIVASEDVRYTPDAIGQLCDLLEAHEVVEPQDYLEPLPWWGSIEAGRILVHRGIEPQPDHGATFGFRRSAVRALRTLGSSDVIDDPARRLAAAGAEVFAAATSSCAASPARSTSGSASVRVSPATISRCRSSRRSSSRSSRSCCCSPLLGGLRLAGVYAGVIAFSSVGLALRGRTGASAFFPLRACLFAPLWVFERSRQRVLGAVPQTARHRSRHLPHRPARTCQRHESGQRRLSRDRAIQEMLGRTQQMLDRIQRNVEMRIQEMLDQPKKCWIASKKCWASSKKCWDRAQEMLDRVQELLDLHPRNVEIAANNCWIARYKCWSSRYKCWTSSNKCWASSKQHVGLRSTITES